MAIKGELIERARKLRGRSQAYLADVLKVDQTYISKLERNKLQGGIKGDELLSLARELEFDPYVFSGEIAFDTGDLRKHPRTDELKTIRETVQKIETRIFPTKTDRDSELVDKIVNTPLLRDLMELVQHSEPVQLQRFKDIAFGYMAGGGGKEAKPGQREARSATG